MLVMVLLTLKTEAAHSSETPLFGVKIQKTIV
jgi:hypothetical protein